MARRNLSTVLVLAMAWMFCCLCATVSAQSTRGMQIQTTATVTSPYGGSVGVALGSDASGSRALVAAGNNLFAVPFDNMGNMGNPIFSTYESDDQIVGAFYDSVNGSSKSRLVLVIVPH
jgi:hypothetical protein